MGMTDLRAIENLWSNNRYLNRSVKSPFGRDRAGMTELMMDEAKGFICFGRYIVIVVTPGQIPGHYKT